MRMNLCVYSLGLCLICLVKVDADIGFQLKGEASARRDKGIRFEMSPGKVVYLKRGQRYIVENDDIKPSYGCVLADHRRYADQEVARMRNNSFYYICNNANVELIGYDHFGHVIWDAIGTEIQRFIQENADQMNVIPDRLFRSRQEFRTLLQETIGRLDFQESLKHIQGMPYYEKMKNSLSFEFSGPFSDKLLYGYLKNRAQLSTLSQPNEELSNEMDEHEAFANETLVKTPKRIESRLQQFVSNNYEHLAILDPATLKQTEAFQSENKECSERMGFFGLGLKLDDDRLYANLKKRLTAKEKKEGAVGVKPWIK